MRKREGRGRKEDGEGGKEEGGCKEREVEKSK